MPLSLAVNHIQARARGVATLLVSPPAPVGLGMTRGSTAGGGLGGLTDVTESLPSLIAEAASRMLPLLPRDPVRASPGSPAFAMSPAP